MWDRIKDFFSSDKPVHVLVVGDVMLDTYIRGVVDRISPEAPVQVLEWKDEYSIPGGAANVACNLSALGCSVRLLGSIGLDPNGYGRGEELKSLLLSKGVDVDDLVVCPERPTTHKVRIIAHNQQMIRIDKEDRSPLGREAYAELFRKVEEIVPLVNGIICSDYAKGFLTPEFMKKILREAELYDKPVVVDPKGRDYGKYAGCSVITPNEKELSLATGLDIKGEADVETAVQKLMADIACRSVLVTRGGHGVSLIMETGETEHISAETKEVYDVTGAGDTVAGVFGMSLFSGLSPQEAAAAANVAGGIVVGKLGTSVVTRDEVLHHFHNRELTAGGKVVKVESLLAELEGRRGRGDKIVFTNGCFDPLHRGHVTMLEQADKLGDILIVGLNSDSSVRNLKGDNRPTVSQDDRAYILGALKSVDYVLIFDEPTPEDLIRALRPDFLIKGADYKIEDVVGGDFVESYGGEVKLIVLVPDKSSSKYLQSIVEKSK